MPLKDFSEEEHQTWQKLFQRQSPLRSVQMVPQFQKGLEQLGIDGTKIPSLDMVNERLDRLTGWQGVPVEGLEEGSDFYEMLAQKRFPVGNFIREAKDLNYTPAPDVFHDLYGHLPFYADPMYAEFCHRFGTEAVKYKKSAKIIREFERFFWFSFEFGLLETNQGRRIFGAGIASSFGECAYALSSKPKVKEFDVEVLRNTEFRIDVFQEVVFVMKDLNQLYSNLESFISPYEKTQNLQS